MLKKKKPNPRSVGFPEALNGILIMAAVDTFNKAAQKLVDQMRKTPIGKIRVIIEMDREKHKVCVR